jgi:hypothetical protein
MTGLRIKLAGNLKSVANLVARDGSGGVTAVETVYFT